ncbi:MAG TPA: DUF4097 family beta strand repeat-containing protein [Streptosporangiaceae bacterium]
MPTFTTPQPISLNVNIGIGAVHITAADRDDTVVEVLPADASRDADLRAAEQTRVRFAGGTLRIRGPRSRGMFGHGPSIDVRVELPAGSLVDGVAAMGELRCEGRLGACRLKTAYGDITLDRSAAAFLDTAYGDVNVHHVDGDTMVTSGSGDIRITAVEGKAMIKNSNGATWIGDAAGGLDVNSANGDITIDRARAAVNARTAYGSIRIGEMVRGELVADTAHGTLEVGIPEGTAAWVDVSSVWGTVRNDLTAAAGPTDSDAETVQVRARTGYGDIVIRRPAGARAEGAS